VPKVNLDGIELHYEASGTGEPVLLVAGFGCDHTIWAGVVTALARRFRVIAFDNRGVGRSTGADTITDIRRLADDAAGLIAALDLGPFHVVGHSMGGMIAQELALAHADRVQSLVLLSSAARLDALSRAVIESWGELPGPLDITTATRLVLPWLYTNRFFEAAGAVDALLHLVVNNPHPPPPAAVFAQSRAISRFDAADRLGGITTPALVIAGQKDLLLPPRYSMELARRIAGAKLAELEECGHNALVESPDYVANTMCAFLEGLTETKCTVGKMAALC